MKNSWLALILLISPQYLFAQWKGNMDIGFSYFSGNVKKMDIRSTGGLSHKDSVFEFSSFYKAIYAETDNIQNNEELSGGIQFDYLPHSRFSPFILFTAFRNQFKNIDLRLSGILGGKYLLYKSDNAAYSISVAYQFDAEQYVEETSDENKNRLSVRPKIKQKIGKGVYFEHVTFFKPNLSNFNDYMIESSSALSNNITDKIKLKLSYEIEYVSQPTKADLLKTDQVMLATLSFSL
jgi:hypothetical protein